MNDELQTEDGFQIVSTKQDPPFTNYTTTKYKAEDDDMFGRGSHFTTDVKNEPKIEDLDRCDVCDKSITSDTLQSPSTSGNNSTSKARRNPSRLAKREVMYPENDCETMADSNNETHFSNGELFDFVVHTYYYFTSLPNLIIFYFQVINAGNVVN